MMEDLLAAFGLSKVSVLTGFLGSALAAFRAKLNKIETVAYFLVGFCVALWGAPAIVHWFKLPEDPSMIGALGFALGFWGMFMLDAIRSVEWKKIIEGWLSRGGSK